MHLHEILRTQLAIAQEKFGPLNILETGTIRSWEPQYADDDGWSTVCFAKWAKEHGGRIESIDLDCSAAEQVLTAKGFMPVEYPHAHGVWLFEEHSIAGLGRRLRGEGLGGAVHLAFLDSDNDPTLILNEYLLVKQLMPSGAILMVDDVDLSPGAEAKKGLAIVPWLEKHGQEYTIAGRRGRGVATGVLITRIP